MLASLLRTAADWCRPTGCTAETAPRDPCPVCGECAAVLAGAVDRRGRPLRTVACVNCGLFRSDPLPAAEELRRFYESQYRLEYKGVRRPKRKHVYRAAKLAALRRRWLVDALRPGETALDIGCGSGEWLYVLQSSGLSPIGIEIDANYAGFGRREYGVDIRTGSLWSVEMPPAAFGVSTLFHVLEHLPNPVESLDRVRGWTKNGGLLALEVPHAGSPNQHPAKRFHPAHVVGFTPGSLALAVARSGWVLTHLFLDRHERNIFAVARNGGGEIRCPPRPLGGVASAPPSAIEYYLRPNTYLRWLERMAQFGAEYGAMFRRCSPRQMVDSLSRTG